MIPVTQTKVVVNNAKGEQVVRGNCYAAAIASIMELPITEVPNVECFFHIKDSTFWAEVMHTFLESLGWELLTDGRYKCFHPEIADKSLGNEEWLAECALELKGKYYLVSGMSPRGVMHICIYQDGKLVHDPHPSRDGLLTLEIFETLEKKVTP